MLPWMLYNCIAEPSCAPRSTYALTPCRRDTQDGSVQKWLEFPCCSLWKLRKGHPFLKTDGRVEDDVFFFTGSVPGLLIVSLQHCVRLFHIHGLIVNVRMPRIWQLVKLRRIVKTLFFWVFEGVWHEFAWLLVLLYIWDEILPHIFMEYFHSPVIIGIPSRHLTELYRWP